MLVKLRKVRTLGTLGTLGLGAMATLALCALGESSARADSSTGAAAVADDATMRPVKPERRNGAVLGASGGIAFAGASGYPSGARFLGRDDFYSASPLLVGYSMSYFLMGALSDHVSFGPMFTIATFESDAWKSTGWGMGFRGEVFPFATAIPMLADLAAYGQLGFGTTELRAKGPYPTAEGSQSFFSIGAHHEWRLGRLLGGHGAIGPYAEFDVINARSAERHWLSTGVRIVWYGGTVKLDQQ